MLTVTPLPSLAETVVDVAERGVAGRADRPVELARACGASAGARGRGGLAGGRGGLLGGAGGAPDGALDGVLEPLTAGLRDGWTLVGHQQKAGQGVAQALVVIGIQPQLSMSR